MKNVAYSSILLIVQLFFVQPLWCMEAPPGSIKSNDLLLREIVLDYGLCHPSICSLVLVDTTYNQLIKKKERVKSRKKCIKNWAAENNVSFIKEQTEWHKHGSVLAHAYVDQRTIGFSLMLECCQLGDGNTVSKKNARWAGNYQNESRCRFVDMIPYLSQPLFNDKGHVRCYGIAEIRENGGEWVNLIREYSFFSVNEVAHSMQCMVNLNSRKLINFISLVEFPVLVKALMNSTHVEISLEGYKVYHLDGAILPNDYQIWKEINGITIVPSFDKLPDIIRKPLEEHFEKQQEKK